MMWREVSCESKTPIKASELPLYGEPSVKFELIEVPKSKYESMITDSREYLVAQYNSVVADSSAKKMYDKAISHSKVGLEYMQKDAGYVTKGVFIVTSGLLGLGLTRGGALRKGFYSSILMGGASAFCYPEEAKDITSQGYTKARNIALHAYKDFIKPGVSDALKPAEVPQPRINQLPSIKQTDSVPAKEPQNSTIAGEKWDRESSKGATQDFGMSNPQDSDMYSTRGSK